MAKKENALSHTKWMCNRLLKDGDEDAVCRELLASQIRQCFAVRQEKYREAFFEEIRVSESDLVTSKEQSMVSKMAFDIYACNHDLDTLEVCKKIDPENGYA